jgi:hypothetical protein
MKNKRVKLAVSEIIGVVLLLGIAVSLFVVVQLIVLSYPFEPSPPSLSLIGSISEQGNITIEHHGGESISLDAKIRIFIDGVEPMDPFIAQNNLSLGTSNGDDFWNIGEIVIISDFKEDLTDATIERVEAYVIDNETNSIIMSGILRGGLD